MPGVPMRPDGKSRSTSGGPARPGPDSNAIIAPILTVANKFLKARLIQIPENDIPDTLGWTTPHALP